MRADDLFSRRVQPVTLIPQTESITAAVRRMVGQRTQGVLPGIAAVIDTQDGSLVGAFSDGDLRRAIAHGTDLNGAVTLVMNSSPVAVPEGESSSAQIQALTRQLRERSAPKGSTPARVSHVFVVDALGRPRGAVDFAEIASAVDMMEASVAVVGMGYVGLTLAVALSSVGYQVRGIERDARIVRDLQSGKLHIHEDGLDQIFDYERRASRLSFDDSLPADLDVVVVTVGTPVDATAGRAEYRALLEAADAIGPRLRQGSLVVLRSTVSLGTTRDIFIPRLGLHTALRAGRDYHVAFAPERTIEGAAMRELRELPQVVGGLTEACLERTCRFFSPLAERMVPVESLEAAEAIKLANNTFRDLSFAFANELALICSEYNINAFKLIAAANDGYPRSRIPMPSPGVGGYCLTKDPHLYSLPRAEGRYTPRLGTAGRRVNEAAAQIPVEHARSFCAAVGKRPSEARVLLVGLAFKGVPENADLRGSTAVQVFHELRAAGFQVCTWDLAVSSNQLSEAELMPWSRVPLAESKLDALLILNNHPGHRSLGWIRETKQIDKPFLFFDGWHQFHEEEIATNNVVYATLGYRSRYFGGKENPG